MSLHAFTDDELLAYLDEQLPVERMSQVETALRGSETLRRRTAGLARQRDHGGHTVGGVWRRMRLSCPSRGQLGSYLLGALHAAEADYIEFHLRTVGCRYCLANLSDLEEEAQGPPDAQQRRRKFFQSSAGLLRPADEG